MWDMGKQAIYYIQDDADWWHMVAESIPIDGAFSSSLHSFIGHIYMHNHYLEWEALAHFCQSTNVHFEYRAAGKHPERQDWFAGQQKQAVIHLQSTEVRAVQLLLISLAMSVLKSWLGLGFGPELQTDFFSAPAQAFAWSTYTNTFLPSG